MFSRRIPRLVRYGLYGSVVIGGSVAGLKLTPDGDFDSMAIVRITRTAYCAMHIGRVYQTMLYSKDWDRTSEEYIETRSRAHQIGASKLLELCKANKGVYIKVGQHVGALDYLLPNEYVTTMRILHKDAPKNTVEELYEVIREDLKVDPNEIFNDFEREPLGTASLAQVHRAKLKDGTNVAVKVQHSFVRKNIYLDLKWMEFIINTMSKIFPEFQMQWLVDETKKNMALELDFLQEGRNSEKAASLFGHFEWLKIPKIFWDYSTDRVLVMEYVEGGMVNDRKFMADHNIDCFNVCQKIGDLYSHMIFTTGFVHSDPHPGNLLLKKDPGDKDVTLYLLDHGLYSQLTDDFQYNYSKLWLSIIDRNRKDMKYYSEQLGVSEELYGLFSCVVTGRTWDAITSGISTTKKTADEKISFQKELPNILPLITQLLEQVDRQALLVLKSNDLIRSLEYALGTNQKMCGYITMSHCCIQKVYSLEYKNEPSFFRKQYLNLQFGWRILLLYVYSFYLNFAIRGTTTLFE